MKHKSNNKPVRLRRPGEAPETFIEMQKIVDRMCKQQQHDEVRKKVIVS
jgi:hypothetical protein